MSELTTGVLEAFDVGTQTIRVAHRIFQVGPLMLMQLKVGQRVTVIWDEAGDTRRAHTVVIARP